MSRSISREELLKLAAMSHIMVTEDEIGYYARQLEARLSYATGLQKILDQHGVPAPAEQRLVNVFREDVVIPTDAEPLLAQAPAREENYFVVPVVVKHAK